MHSADILNACWKVYDEKKMRSGLDPNCFSPEELWEFDFLVNLIQRAKPHLDHLTVLLAVREGMRRTVAPRPRQHFVELVMSNIHDRELQWSNLLQNIETTDPDSPSSRYPFTAN